MERVHLQNKSGSQLALTTLGLIMDRDIITAETFDKEKLDSLEDVQKFKSLGWIKYLSDSEAQQTQEKHAAAKAAAIPAELEPIVPVEDLEIEGGVQDQIKDAVANIEAQLQFISSLMTTKKVGKKPSLSRKKAKALPPPEETEAAQGTFEGAQPPAAQPAQAPPTEREDDEFIPDVPPAGMEPRNDIIKRLLGRAPYTKGASQQDKLKFIQSSMDVGLLREFAIFEKPGQLKDLGKKKLRLAKAEMNKPVRV